MGEARTGNEASRWGKGGATQSTSHRTESYSIDISVLDLQFGEPLRDTLSVPRYGVFRVDYETKRGYAVLRTCYCATCTLVCMYISGPLCLRLSRLS